MFTHVVRRGGRTYIQYWLYYPDSNSTVAGRATSCGTRARCCARRARYPGYHPDDWESYQVRVERNGDTFVRASSHHGYKGCKRCTNRWTPWTGWTRVSRGSHAGHIPLNGSRRKLPGVNLRERTSTGDGLRLVPLEKLPGRGRYRPLDKGIKPPWKKGVWRDPASNGT